MAHEFQSQDDAARCAASLALMNPLNTYWVRTENEKIVVRFGRPDATLTYVTSDDLKAI